MENKYSQEQIDLYNKYYGNKQEQQQEVQPIQQSNLTEEQKKIYDKYYGEQQGVVSRGIDYLRAGTQGVVGGLAESLGNLTGSEALKGIAESTRINQEEIYKNLPYDVQQKLNEPGFNAEKVYNIAGQAVPNIAAMLIPGAGVAKGAQALGAGAKALKAVEYGVPSVIGGLTGGGQKSIQTRQEFLTNPQNIAKYGENTPELFAAADEAAKQSNIEGGLVDAAGAALSVGVGNVAPNLLSKGITTGGLKGAGIAAAADLPFNIAQGYTDEAIVAKNVGREFNPEAAKEGALYGALVGSAISGVTGYKKRSIQFGSEESAQRRMDFVAKNENKDINNFEVQKTPEGKFIVVEKEINQPQTTDLEGLNATQIVNKLAEEERQKQQQTQQPITDTVVNEPVVNPFEETGVKTETTQPKTEVENIVKADTEKYNDLVSKEVLNNTETVSDLVAEKDQFVPKNTVEIPKVDINSLRMSPEESNIAEGINQRLIGLNVNRKTNKPNARDWKQYLIKEEVNGQNYMGLLASGGRLVDSYLTTQEKNDLISVRNGADVNLRVVENSKMSKLKEPIMVVEYNGKFIGEVDAEYSRTLLRNINDNNITNLQAKVSLVPKPYGKTSKNTVQEQISLTAVGNNRIALNVTSKIKDIDKFIKEHQEDITIVNKKLKAKEEPVAEKVETQQEQPVVEVPKTTEENVKIVEDYVSKMKSAQTIEEIYNNDTNFFDNAGKLNKEFNIFSQNIKKMKNRKDYILALKDVYGEDFANFAKKALEKDIITYREIYGEEPPIKKKKSSIKKMEDTNDIDLSKEEDLSTDPKTWSPEKTKIIKEINKNRYSVLGWELENFKDDYDVFLNLIKNGEGLYLQYSSDRLRDNYNIAMEAAKAGKGADFISERLRDNYNIAKEIVKRFGYDLQYISKRLQDNEDIVKLSINPYDYFGFKYASDRLRNSGDFILNNINNIPSKYWGEIVGDKILNKYPTLKDFEENYLKDKATERKNELDKTLTKKTGEQEVPKRRTKLMEDTTQPKYENKLESNIVNKLNNISAKDYKYDWQYEDEIKKTLKTIKNEPNRFGDKLLNTIKDLSVKYDTKDFFKYVPEKIKKQDNYANMLVEYAKKTNYWWFIREELKYNNNKFINNKDFWTKLSKEYDGALKATGDDLRNDPDFFYTIKNSKNPISNIEAFYQITFDKLKELLVSHNDKFGKVTDKELYNVWNSIRDWKIDKVQKMLKEDIGIDYSKGVTSEEVAKKFRDAFLKEADFRNTLDQTLTKKTGEEVARPKRTKLMEDTTTNKKYSPEVNNVIENFYKNNTNTDMYSYFMYPKNMGGKLIDKAILQNEKNVIDLADHFAYLPILDQMKKQGVPISDNLIIKSLKENQDNLKYASDELKVKLVKENTSNLEYVGNDVEQARIQKLIDTEKFAENLDQTLTKKTGEQAVTQKKTKLSSDEIKEVKDLTSNNAYAKQNPKYAPIVENILTAFGGRFDINIVDNNRKIYNNENIKGMAEEIAKENGNNLNNVLGFFVKNNEKPFIYLNNDLIRQNINNKDSIVYGMSEEDAIATTAVHEILGHGSFEMLIPDLATREKLLMDIYNKNSSLKNLVEIRKNAILEKGKFQSEYDKQAEVFDLPLMVEETLSNLVANKMIVEKDGDIRLVEITDYFKEKDNKVINNIFNAFKDLVNSVTGKNIFDINETLREGEINSIRRKLLSMSKDMLSSPLVKMTEDYINTNSAQKVRTLFKLSEDATYMNKMGFAERLSDFTDRYAKLYNIKNYNYSKLGNLHNYAMRNKIFREAYIMTRGFLSDSQSLNKSATKPFEYLLYSGVWKKKQIPKYKLNQLKKILLESEKQGKIFTEQEASRLGFDNTVYQYYKDVHKGLQQSRENYLKTLYFKEIDRIGNDKIKNKETTVPDELKALVLKLKEVDEFTLDDYVKTVEKMIKDKRYGFNDSDLEDIRQSVSYETVMLRSPWELPREQVGDYYYWIEDTKSNKAIVFKSFKSEGEREASIKKQILEPNQKIVRRNSQLKSGTKIKSKETDVNDWNIISAKLRSDNTDLDILSSIVKHIDKSSKYASKNINLLYLERYIKEINDKGTNPQEVRDMNELKDYVLEEKRDISIEGRMKSFLKKANTFLFLSGSAATSIFNLASLPLAVWPNLQSKGAKKLTLSKSALVAGAFYGTKGKDFADYAANSGMFKGNEKEAELLLSRLQRSGILEEIDLDNMNDFLKNKMDRNFIEKLPGAAFDVFIYTFKMTEIYNRRTTALALMKTAFDNKEKLNLKTEMDIMNFIRDGIAETQGSYTKENRPVWARSPVGEVLYAFKTYPITQIETWSRYISNKQYKTAMLASLIMLAVIGEENMPFMEDLEDVIDGLGRGMNFNTQTENWKKNALESILGKEGAYIAMYGLTGALGLEGAGQRMGLSNVLPGTRLVDPTNTNKMKTVLEFLGPTGSAVLNTGTGALSILEGQFSRGFTELSPNFIKNIITAGKAAQNGYFRTKDGKNMSEADTVEVIAKFFGFQPNDIVRYYNVMKTTNSNKDIIKYIGALANTKMADAIINNDKQSQLEAVEFIKKWNKDNPELPIFFNKATIKQKVQGAKLDPKILSLQSAPKQLRAQLKQDLEELEE